MVYGFTLMCIICFVVSLALAVALRWLYDVGWAGALAEAALIAVVCALAALLVMYTLGLTVTVVDIVAWSLFVTLGAVLGNRLGEKLYRRKIARTGEVMGRYA